MRANAGSKSKRSVNSVSSNPSSADNTSNGGKNSNKKKKVAQKTLGVAWGASSRSSSRSAFRNSPFSDFGSYMAVKNQKLHEQFDAAAASSSSHSGNIFSGVSIFIDGYTVPSSQELRGYMLKHGGRFENYFSRHLVTHIICSNLPDSKIKNLRAFSGGLPVVKPAWVLDSIAANKLLSWIPYQLDQLATENYNQPKLSAFFTPKNSGASESANFLVGDQDDQLKNKVDFSLSKEHTSSDQADLCRLEHGDLLELDIDRVVSEEPSCSVESSCEVKSVEISDCSPLDGKNSDLEYRSSTCQASVSHCSNSFDNHNPGEASTSSICLPPNQRHSTLADPNFVENYFKSSRLHFIGTWRSRYRKRFASLSNGLRHESSSFSTVPVSEKNVVIHIDMDCFFVSVVIRDRPELLDKPVAVCHSDNPRGTSEISSANYPAREYGVKAGMFVKDAKIRCPELVIVSYDFEAYEMVADQLYDILHKHCNKVQAVSCDEAFLDVSVSEVGDPQVLTSIIRKEIFETTRCTASAGIAGNMLMARLATKTAKPDGQCYIPPENVDNYLCTLPVKALPGIGRVLEEKLKKKEITTCGQLRLITKEYLQKDFGMKTGEMLWNYSRGIDNRLVGVIQESKSVGAEVNWGVRFMNSNDAQHFLANLCKEVALRLQGCGVHGRSFTLKIKKKKSDAGEPVKYMGCGDCENMSHTITIPMATDDVDVLQRLASQLFGHFHIDVKDIRGVGLQVSKLEGADDSKLVHKRNSILPWLVPTSAQATERKQTSGVSKHDTQRRSDGALGHPSFNTTGSSVEMGAGLSSSETGVPPTTSLPSLQDLDFAVIEFLPPEVVSEINDMYGGKLLGFISNNKRKTFDANIPAASPEGVSFMDTKSLPEAALVELNMRTGGAAAPTSFSVDNIMPSSLSQVDYSVLQELPDELRKDIIDLLPSHREAEVVIGASGNSADEQTEYAQIYESGSGGGLSSLLQHLMFRTLPVEMGNSGSDAVSWLCELFRQYIDLKIATDIEEIYACVCLLRRLRGKSEVLLQVYDAIHPHLQASMCENYGGTLSILLV